MKEKIEKKVLGFLDTNPEDLPEEAGALYFVVFFIVVTIQITLMIKDILVALFFIFFEGEKNQSSLNLKKLNGDS